MKTLSSFSLLLILASCQSTESVRQKKIIDEMSIKIQESNKKMGESDQANANINLKLDQMTEHLGRMQGQVDDLAHHYDLWNKEWEVEIAKKQELETKLTELSAKQKQIDEYLQQVVELLKNLKAHPPKMSKVKKESETPAIDGDYAQGIELYEKKDYNNALVHLSRFFTKSPNSGYAPNALLNIGKMLQEMGKKQEAKEAFQKIIKNYPRSQRVHEAKKLLESF